MTGDQTLDRRLAAWIEDATTAPPDNLLDRTLARVDATRQRPGWLAGELALPLGGARAWFVPAWVVIVLAILAAILVVAGSTRLLWPPSPAVLVEASPSPSGPPVATALASVATEASSAPTPAPTPLGGGPILAHTLDQGRHKVLAIDAGTGEQTLLGTLFGSEITTYPHYTFQRSATGDHVLILGGDGRGLDSPTDASRGFAFFTPEELNLACCPRDIELSPRGDLVAFINADRFDNQIDITIHDVSGGKSRTFPLPPDLESLGVISWTPDESKLVLAGCHPCNGATDPVQAQTPHHTHLYVVPLDGSAGQELLDVDNGAVVGTWLTGIELLTSTWMCAAGSVMPRCDPAEGQSRISTLSLVDGGQTVLAETTGLFEFKVSPDASRVAYRTNEGLWIRTVDGRSSLRVGDADAFEPDWSPDGQWLLFHRSQFDLWIVPSAGGAARQIATDVSGATWLSTPR